MDSQFLLHFIRDNLPLLLFLFFMAVLVGGWVVFESARSLLKRDDVDKLRRRVEELEREQARFVQPVPTRRVTNDPVVLPTRWVGAGHAATSADGGCLVLVDQVIPAESRAIITIRVDGLPVHQRHSLAAGSTVELRGKSGFYTVEVGAVSGPQAQISAWLRSHHAPL